MTPEQKAEQLVKRYSCLHHGIEENLLEKVVISDYAIQSALISVDEIIKALRKGLPEVGLGKGYWYNVKQEIEKL